ncbi:MAG: hypothetical protein K0S78_1148 [Thermomicrobiales bacterium]|nr:hypothetical protein [Thermomicrobiales bacterium]MDF3037740.1 hypothetical protein [Thermomicrobiales bacterium]
MFNRENAIGLILLVLCAAVALVLLYSIATGTRFRFEGPSWLGTALMILFIGATAFAFFTRPGRRWPWQRNEPPDQERDER